MTCTRWVEQFLSVLPWVLLELGLFDTLFLQACLVLSSFLHDFDLAQHVVKLATCLLDLVLSLPFSIPEPSDLLSELRPLVQQFLLLSARTVRP